MNNHITICPTFIGDFAMPTQSVDLDKIDKVSTTVSTSSTATLALSKQYNHLRKLSNLPQIDLAFIFENKTQANNLRANLNHRLSLVKLGICLTQKDNCVFIESLKNVNKSHSESILIFQNAIVNRVNKYRQANKLSITELKQVIKEATSEETMAIQKCYELHYPAPIVKIPEVIAPTSIAKNNSNALVTQNESDEDELMPFAAQTFSTPLSISTNAIFNDLIIEIEHSPMRLATPDANPCWANLFSPISASTPIAADMEWENDVTPTIKSP